MAFLHEQRAIRRTTAALFLIGLFFSASALAEPGNNNRAPDLSDYQKLIVPEGNKVAFYAYAEGVQIYAWNGSSWVFVRPEAVLYAGPQAPGVVGAHYVGPTWESNSGSYVVGSVLERFSPTADSIPWLLLKAVDSDGAGVFHGITYIQRVHTVGGIAPSAPGEFVDEVARVPYTADYYFYRQQK